MATKTTELSPNPFLFDVLDLVVKQRTKAKKVEMLQKYRDDSILTVFMWNFHPDIISDLPVGEVPYGSIDETGPGDDTLSRAVEKQIKSPSAIMDTTNRTSIARDHTMFYNFIQGGNLTLSRSRRETMFINLLEGLHPREAEILILTKDKRLTDKYPISIDVIREAYPDAVKLTW
jgi:hypothetical protein